MLQSEYIAFSFCVKQKTVSTTSLEIVRPNSLSDIDDLKFFQCCRDIIRDSIVNDTHVYAAIRYNKLRKLNKAKK